MRGAAVTPVGIGDDGCASLSARSIAAIARAQVLAGSERHLGFFPQFKGERIVLKNGVKQALERIALLADEHNVCILASWLCENLAGPDERVREFTLRELAACQDVRPLNVLILQRTDPAWRVPPSIPFIHEDQFAKRMPKKGLITKREIRLLSLAAMDIRSDRVIWDIGAGSGSVSIEAAMLASEGRVYAYRRISSMLPLLPPTNTASGVSKLASASGARPSITATLSTQCWCRFFATEGDPSVYSSFIYLQREAFQRWPDVQVEVVPGVSSITAVPSVTGVPLADGLEQVAIIPAGYGVDDLADILNRFDTTILMKIGSEIPKVIAALEATGLTDRAVYVSHATMREQRIVRDVRQLEAERGDCFAMIVVFRKERSGVLAGDVQRTHFCIQ